MKLNSKFQHALAAVILGATIFTSAFCAYANIKPHAYDRDAICIAVTDKYATFKTYDRKDGTNYWKVSRTFRNKGDGEKVRLHVGRYYCVWFNDRATQKITDDKVTDIWAEAK